jgi:glycosyltransferase involved in cell wall biosynthesis
MLPRIHALIDLSRTDADALFINEFLQLYSSPDSLLGIVDHLTVLIPSEFEKDVVKLPPDWRLVATRTPIKSANDVMRWAGANNAHLIVLLGLTYLPNEALGLLVEAFQIDPHFGVCIPRQLNRATGEVRKLLDSGGDPDLEFLPRRVLTEIPDIYIVPELLKPCMVIRNSLVANLSQLDESFATFAGALQLYLSRIRRAGFRTVVLNRAVIDFGEIFINKTLVPKGDVRRLHSIQPDAGIAKGEIADAPIHVYESLLGHLFTQESRLRKTLLLDIRGVRDFVNGTAEAVLALCDGLRSIKTDWHISLLVDAAAAEYHRLESRYAGWDITTSHIGRYFTVAVRASQPWHISTMIELHNLALFNFFTMLDTISWDILFEAPHGLGATWDFMSQHADGLLYNSHYTRDHVIRRFPSTADLPAHVFQHSFHPADYAQPFATNAEGTRDYIFLIGNGYDHKHLIPTLDLLTSAFPFQTFKVLGLKNYPRPTVVTLESGKISQEEINALFGEARAIVFPSFYEGFGLPVLKGLSYGRPVITRRSSLVSELASNYRGPGTLLEFETPVELVNILGATLHNCQTNYKPLGTNLAEGEQPKRWSDIARDLLKFVDTQITSGERRQWLTRDRAIRQLVAFSA